MIKKLAIAAFAVLMLTSCDQLALLAGLVYSYSTPDERFDESFSMEYETDPSLIKNLGPEYQFILWSDIQGQDRELPQMRIVQDQYMVPEDKFIIDLGDSTEHGWEEEFVTYRTIMGSYGVPYFQTIGNHDVYNEGWKHYRKYMGKPTFTLEIGNRDSLGTGSMLLISIDSANSTLGPKQMKWLEETLEAESGRWDHLIVFSHAQFFADPVTTVVQFSDTNEIYKLIHLFETYEVDIMFAGHVHVWNFRTLGGVQYVTIPPLEDGNSEDAFVRVYVNGSDLRWEKIVMSED